MMPPPPPPAPRPHQQSQLLKLSNSFTSETFDCSTKSFDMSTEDLIKNETECFSLGCGSELELLAEAAIATDPREEEFYESNEKELHVNNLGRTCSSLLQSFVVIESSYIHGNTLVYFKVERHVRIFKAFL